MILNRASRILFGASFGLLLDQTMSTKCIYTIVTHGNCLISTFFLVDEHRFTGKAVYLMQFAVSAY